MKYSLALKVGLRTTEEQEVSGGGYQRQLMYMKRYSRLAKDKNHFISINPVRFDNMPACTVNGYIVEFTSGLEMSFRLPDAVIVPGAGRVYLEKIDLTIT